MIHHGAGDMSHSRVAAYRLNKIKNDCRVSGRQIFECGGICADLNDFRAIAERFERRCDRIRIAYSFSVVGPVLRRAMDDGGESHH
jgi:hypothetical protein